MNKKEQKSIANEIINTSSKKRHIEWKHDKIVRDIGVKHEKKTKARPQMIRKQTDECKLQMLKLEKYMRFS